MVDLTEIETEETAEDASEIFVPPSTVEQEFLRLPGGFPLWQAVERSDLEAVKGLLSSGASSQLFIQNEDAHGDTVMHAAIRRAQVDFLEIFLNYGAPVNAINDAGQTLLHVAVVSSDDAAVILLHAHHADSELIDNAGCSPLAVAAERGMDQMIDLLIEKYPDSFHFRMKDGSTLVHLAALSGHSETVVTLLDKGVYLLMPNRTGSCALHVAARAGHATVVRTLLRRKANVDAKTKDNYTALHLAIEHGFPDVVEELLEAGASVNAQGGKNGETPIHIAARAPGGDTATWFLLKSGSKLNTPMENGETALHVAARAGSMVMVKLLLHEGADPMIISSAGETAFHVAVRACHYEVAETLIRYIAARWKVKIVTMTNNEGETALHLVAQIEPARTHERNEDLHLLQLVLEYNTSVGSQTKHTFETALHYCARSGNEKVLSALLDNWGPVKTQTVINRQSHKGWSPLMTASEGGQLGIVEILSNNHARMDIFDDLGKAALHIAAENGHLEVVDLLLKNRAFVNAKTKTGLTALHLAAMNGFPEIVRLLVEKYDAPVDLFTIERKTPLHLATQYGKLDICEMLLKMGASPDLTDEHGQNALHIAAEFDIEEVVELFLKVLSHTNPLTIADVRGNTIAHIAAKNGSIEVMKLLLHFNKQDIISSRSRGSDATVLQVAAAGGHVELVKMLLNAGASPAVENSEGLTAFHLAAKFGHNAVIEVLRDVFPPQTSSVRNGLTGLHVAAYYGQAEAAREILTTVSATIRSDDPTVSTSIGNEVGAEAGLTPLHVACKAGQEEVARMILNYSGVQVDAPTDRTKYIPLHMAALNGHSDIVALLLSRFGNQLNVPDAKGQTALMLAATRGHQNMATILIAQGSDLSAVDHNGWTALHFAAVAGRPEMTELLCTSGADTTVESIDRKIALCYAAHSAHSDRHSNAGHMKVMTYLMQQKYDCFALLKDRVFLMDLMLCALHNGQKPIKEFIRFCPSPVELALKLSKFYRDTADIDKYHSKDLLMASRFCQQSAGRMLTIACSRFSSSDLLRAVDTGGVSLMDDLIIGGHKEAVALLPVQQFLSTIFRGAYELKAWHIFLSFVLCFFCPPLWFVLSLPWPHPISEVPFLKLVVQITSHLYYILIMISVFMSPFQFLYDRTDFTPRWEEWLLLLWIAGNFVAELTSHDERKGLGMLRSVTLAFSFAAIIIHIAAACTEEYTSVVLLYIRCQLLAVACFFADIQILSYLSFHQLFGPFGVMLGDIVHDLERFLVFFGLFIFGFAFSLSALFEDVVAEPELNENDYPGAIIMDMVLDPFAALQWLYWAVFGMVDPRNPKQLFRPIRSPPFAFELVRFMYGIYLIATMIVLINLLIAMLSDTYQRIKARSDLEWKFIRAKIIISLEKTPISPPPINTFTLAGSYLYEFVTMMLEPSSSGKVHSEISMNKGFSIYAKMRQWRKTASRTIAERNAGSSHDIHQPFTKTHRAQRLVDVIPWAEIVSAGDDFDYGVSMDDFE